VYVIFPTFLKIKKNGVKVKTLKTEQFLFTSMALPDPRTAGFQRGRHVEGVVK